MARAGELTSATAATAAGLAPHGPWLVAALAGSLLVHVGALGLGALGTNDPGAAVAGRPAHAVQVVALAAAQAPAPEVVTPTEPAAAPEVAVPTDPAAAVVAPAPPALPEPSSDLDPLRAVAPPALPSAPPAAAEVVPVAVAGSDGPDYLPRDRLSVVPAPVEEVVVPFPESVGFEFRATVRLALFVDETGQVRQVRVEQSNVGPDFEQAARSAFLAARFTPGEVDGRPVRALLRVEVEFESRRRVEAGDAAASAPSAVSAAASVASAGRR